MKNYNHLLEILKQFMNLELSHNLIWSGNQEYATMVFAECGYHVGDWSWYDGHIVNFDCEHYPGIGTSYVACGHSYSVHRDDISIVVHEYGELSNQNTPEKVKTISLSQYSTVNTNVSDYTDRMMTLSPEFTELIVELKKWICALHNPGYVYNIDICIKEGNNVNDL